VDRRHDFRGAILVPIARAMPPRERAALLHGVGLRFSAVSWACFGVLLITGPWLLFIRGRRPLLGQPAALAGTAFGHMLLAKLGMILVMALLSLLHDFRWGPQLVAALRREGDHDPADPAGLAALRKRAALTARANLALGVLVVALGVMLAM